jgi:hypothetical protein
MPVIARPLIAVTATVCIACSAVSAGERNITWSDLAPPAVEYSNPFEGLNADQMDDLRALLSLRLRIESGEEAVTGQAEALRAGLEAQALDVDWLFAKRLEIMEIREKAATGVNGDLIGDTVRIPGYLLPLEVKDRKAVEFLLVPTVGACIHTPPPPANQMVHVTYPEGIEIKGLYDPIWIVGDLASQRSEQAVRYVDGEARVQVSYAMQAASVEPYR